MPPIKKVKEEVPQAPPRPKYVSKIRMFHPYQKVYIHDLPVTLDMDGWLEAQIEAGIVKQWS
jgi:hypothetical protein